eukprot:GHVU01052014.1.p2 GENE.GHVU01052014.1~~GHVU01052014.1.p2  ORF type:complete len:113 (-),score=11.57 GHVU01052014.1:741-1079(-)
MHASPCYTSGVGSERASSRFRRMYAFKTNANEYWITTQKERRTALRRGADAAATTLIPIEPGTPRCSPWIPAAAKKQWRPPQRHYRRTISRPKQSHEARRHWKLCTNGRMNE